VADGPLVSVIVATRDRPESLRTCLDALLRLTYPRREIIVVDNAPTSNATMDLVTGAFGHMPHLRYTREDRPGLGRAHNHGLGLARGEMVAMTDDDVVPDPEWLTELVRAFAVDERVGCVTGLILPYELETPAQLWFEQYGGFGRGFNRRVFDLSEHRPADRLYPLTAGKFGAGANMAFRTHVLRSIGGFDPTLGPGTPTLGGEDIDAFFRVITAGYQLAYEPGAFVYHVHRREYTPCTGRFTPGEPATPRS
jgi:GT2 family glycosyltransferase